MMDSLLHFFREVSQQWAYRLIKSGKPTRAILRESDVRAWRYPPLMAKIRLPNGYTSMQMLKQLLPYYMTDSEILEAWDKIVPLVAAPRGTPGKQEIKRLIRRSVPAHYMSYLSGNNDLAITFLFLAAQEKERSFTHDKVRATLTLGDGKVLEMSCARVGDVKFQRRRKNLNFDCLYDYRGMPTMCHVAAIDSVYAHLKRSGAVDRVTLEWVFSLAVRMGAAAERELLAYFDVDDRVINRPPEVQGWDLDAVSRLAELERFVEYHVGIDPIRSIKAIVVPALCNTTEFIALFGNPHGVPASTFTERRRQKYLNALRSLHPAAGPRTVTIKDKKSVKDVKAENDLQAAVLAVFGV